MANSIIGCPIDEATDARVKRTIADLRASPDNISRDEVISLVSELTDLSFQYHFVRPLQPLGVGFATRKSIDVGLAGAKRVIRSSLQRVIGGMNDEQFVQLADFLEQAYFPEAG